ncbi:helix-turn-helix domain-containing protein [Mycobacterium intracellulare]|uniref:Helix-turn-helix transcriptional regulator n=1 Tax=Mycobacterium intracellulare subsp. chimaera TaxID=222805 RepID=A0ABT7P5X2_MYCIT|nr:helix-turn-helix transcriptional regulator [Mycobacterium intracellulare]MDM3928675.1 helix-turn-helix transcriptional regulator [Mycobacterium intracellulare subsp. chimaera]
MTDDAGLSVAVLRSELNRLRLAAGEPSLRSIAQKTGWSRATVGRVFNGEVPKWDSLEAVVEHLGGDCGRFRQLWIECKQAPPAQPSPPAVVAPAARLAFAPAVAGGCLALLFVIVSVQGIAPAATARNQAITDGAQLGFGVLATGLWSAVCYRYRAAGDALGLTLGLAGWSAGQGYWLVARDIFNTAIPAAPSLADWLYLVFPVCVISGFLVGLPTALRWVWAVVLGALMASTTAATVLGLWVANRGPVGAAVVYALYVVSDLAVVVIFSWRAHRQRDWASAVALTGVVVLLVSDVLFVYFAWWRPQASIPYGADVGYIIFPLAMSVAASYTLEARGRQQR